MPIDAFLQFPPMASTLSARQKLSQAMIMRQVAQSVVITFASGSQVTLRNATVTQSDAGANGGGTIQITYQG